MSTEIISRELPQHLIDDIVYGTNNDNAGSIKLAHASFAEAQRASIRRFCDEVAKQQLRFMESGTFAAMGQFVPEYAQAAAFQLIRDTTLTTEPTNEER